MVAAVTFLASLSSSSSLSRSSVPRRVSRRLMASTARVFLRGALLPHRWCKTRSRRRCGVKERKPRRRYFSRTSERMDVYGRDERMDRRTDGPAHTVAAAASEPAGSTRREKTWQRGAGEDLYPDSPAQLRLRPRDDAVHFTRYSPRTSDRFRISRAPPPSKQL